MAAEEEKTGAKEAIPSPADITNPDALQALAEQLGENFLPDGWQRVASSAFSRVAHNGEEQLYFKEFLPRSPAESLKARLRGSRAQRARDNGALLRYYGFDAPEILHRGTLPGGSEYLFMRAGRGRSVHELLEDSGVGPSERRRLLRDLGKFIGRLHATGFTHGDLRPGNILGLQCEGRFQFTLLDNERNRLQSPPSGRRLLRNLMQLNMLPPEILSAFDRMRFFRAWHSQMRHLTNAEAKILARESYAWACRRMAKKH